MELLLSTLALTLVVGAAHAHVRRGIRRKARWLKAVDYLAERLMSLRFAVWGPEHVPPLTWDGESLLRLQSVEHGPLCKTCDIEPVTLDEGTRSHYDGQTFYRWTLVGFVCPECGDFNGHGGSGLFAGRLKPGSNFYGFLERLQDGSDVALQEEIDRELAQHVTALRRQIESIELQRATLAPRAGYRGLHSSDSKFKAGS